MGGLIQLQCLRCLALPLMDAMAISSSWLTSQALLGSSLLRSLPRMLMATPFQYLLPLKKADLCTPHRGISTLLLASTASPGTSRMPLLVRIPQVLSLAGTWRTCGTMLPGLDRWAF